MNWIWWDFFFSKKGVLLLYDHSVDRLIVLIGSPAIMCWHYLITVVFIAESIAKNIKGKGNIENWLMISKNAQKCVDLSK